MWSGCLILLIWIAFSFILIVAAFRLSGMISREEEENAYRDALVQQRSEDGTGEKD